MIGGKGDPFKLLGVQNEDKMAFFLLKWVFNAINKIDISGVRFVTKKDLIKQLDQNAELLAALNYANIQQLTQNLKLFKCTDADSLTWQEFLNFFFIEVD